MRSFIAGLLLVSLSASAHELTPTYPLWNKTFEEGVFVAELSLFNRREDVQYFAIGVYDTEWQKVPFAASTKLLRVPYLQKKDFRVYIQATNLGSAVYICTKSKILKGIERLNAVSSTICSKTK